jgi:hypothetical protein|tara:strand:+ start:18321 stop:18494 length:174 start_codon:yes stop_codon:yes gene_type:complete
MSRRKAEGCIDHRIDERSDKETKGITMITQDERNTTNRAALQAKSPTGNESKAGAKN